MVTETLSKDTLRAVKFFEEKLEFEWSPIGLAREIEEGKRLQVIDLRTVDLYEKAHVPGAQHILYENLEQHINKLDKEIPTVVYCYDILCKLAARAALLLAKNGVNAKELAGGFDEWEKRNLPVEKGKQSVSERAVSHGSCSTSKGSCA